jgi:hypothetical protein
MFSATHVISCRPECGAAYVRGEPPRTLVRATLPTSGVKRSVLAMSMRFSYDSTADRARHKLNPTMTARTASTPTPRDNRQEAGRNDFLPQHMT